MASRRPAPRPKRGGEEFARTHHLDDEGSSSKKPRFDVRNPSALAPDALEEDAVLEVDEIGKRGQQAKRNAVNIDGYESDSSNEGFDGRAEAKAKEAAKNGKQGTGSKAEEDSDMFADLDEELGDGDKDDEKAGINTKKKKNVRFLEAEEIEGQVAGSKSGGHVSADFSLNGSGPGLNGNGTSNFHDKEAESSSESDVAEEVRADIEGQVDEEVGAGGKKAHAPKLDAFNMKSEQEEGRFDAHGNFVRKAMDPDAVHDLWLEGVSKKDMKKAKEAEDRRDLERQQKALEDDAVLTSDILKDLIPHLERSETVLEALARLGRGKDKKKKWQTKKHKRNPEEAMNTDGDSNTTAEDPTETRRRDAVEAITGAADKLLTRGQVEIYDAERELLVRQYRRETGGEDWIDPPAPERELVDEDGPDGEREMKRWEYRWSDARDGGEIHGPYEGRMMVEWTDAGYFGDGVEFRRVGEGEEKGGGEWSRLVDFV